MKLEVNNTGARAWNGKAAMCSTAARVERQWHNYRTGAKVPFRKHYWGGRLFRGVNRFCHWLEERHPQFANLLMGGDCPYFTKYQF